MTDALYAAEVRRHVLALREALVRHDENLKADELLQRSIPYYLLDDPEIARAREDQRQMVLHIRDPEAYAEYYGTNPHERPFEEQYGIQPEQAHEHLYRVKFLREGLKRQCEAAEVMPDKLAIVDTSANDGWMAVNLGELGYRVVCVDLHPGNCELARQRQANGSEAIEKVIQGDLRGQWAPGWFFDAVCCFETLEHVPDPDEALGSLTRMCRGGGRLYLSTPFEAVEQGNLPNWAHVEPKGHVRAFRAKDFEQLLERHGDVKRFEIGPDRMMVAELEPAR